MLLNRARADALMDRDGIDAIVATSPINAYYLSSWATDASWGFGDLAMVVLPRDHALPPAVITIEIDSGQPQQHGGTWMDIIRTYRRKPGIGAGGRPVAGGADDLHPDHAAVVYAYLEELKLLGGRIAFEDRGLGYDVARRTEGRLDVVDGRDFLRDVRMVKTPQEMALLRAATRKTELGLMAAAEAVAAGATCAEAERVFWSTVPLIGGRPVFLLITPFRPGEGRKPKTERLQPGDTVNFDATAEFAHYTSDIGRTAIIGEPGAEQVARYNAIRRGWRAALPEFQAGRMSDAVETLVVKSIQAAGNPDVLGAGIHSVGLEHTDHPHPGNALAPFELIDGSVLSCDLPWMSPDIGRFHFEDLIYLNGGEVETLNDSDSRLFACIGGRTVRVE
jgi:Xaa-Pro dipeptidase